MIERALAITFVCCLMLAVGTADDVASENKPGRLSRAASIGANVISKVTDKAKEIQERMVNPPPHIGGQTSIPNSMVRAGGRIASNYTVEILRAARTVFGAGQQLVGKTLAATGQVIEQAGSRVQHLRKQSPPASFKDPSNQGSPQAAPTADPNQGFAQSTQTSTANSNGSPPAINGQSSPSGAASASPGLQPNELRKVSTP